FPSRQRFVDWFDAPKILRNRRKRITLLTVKHITYAHFDLIERVKHAEFGQRHGGEPVNLGRVTRRKRIEPTAAARATSRSAVLTAAFANQLAQLRFAFKHFRRERSFADARRVRAHNAKHAAEMFRRQPRSHECATDNGAG